ncbi:MAG TPA: family 1 glycosylhydrolase, partial [Candidatus Nanopelagicales bacterium]
IWDEFADVPGAIADGSTADPGCEHVVRMAQDVDLLAWLGVDAYRFSVAWARVQPGGRGPLSPEGLDHYDRLCDALLERGIAPLVTLYHWDLPSELHARGGWLDPRTGELFGQYANAVATRLGDRVGSWATLNEPWCSAFLGHAAGIHAPGRQVPAEALEVAYRLLVAHARGLEGLRAAGVQQAGIVLNLMPTFADDPYRDDPVVQQAARHVDALQCGLWLDALAGRGLNADVVAGTAALTDWSFADSTELGAVAAPIDWLGVNYYTVQRLVPVAEAGDRAVAQDVAAHPGCPPVHFAPRPPLTTMGWEVNARGLRTTLEATAAALPGVPLWVAENGMACDDVVVEGRCEDPARVDYLTGHLEQVIEARAAGIDVRGYLLWSLFDNIEWAEGWRQRFGIVHVDADTQARTPKASARWLRVLQTRRRGHYPDQRVATAARTLHNGSSGTYLPVKGS